MSIQEKIRDALFASANGKVFFYKIRILREKFALLFISDYKYVKKTYKKRFGRNINLSNPMTYTEKLQWLKLFYRNDDMPRCTDKYEVRNYLAERGYGHLCNELIGVYDDARKIDFSSLPKKFAAKANHGSAWNLICKDKERLVWKDEVRVMNCWLKLNLYVFGREWNYEKIPPRIVVEKFLDHEPLNDYKFMCFNGEPLYMQLNNDYEGVHYVDFYDLKTWEHLPVTYGRYNRSDRTIEKPLQFDKMMELAKELSKPFPFVRVDFYNFDETILFGELTFFPGGGLWPLNPVKYGIDELFGEQLQLPEPNHNLKLYRKIMKKK